MKKILVPVVMAFMAFAPFAVEWQTITLTEKVTVSMPGKPVEDKSKGIPIQKVVLEDGSEMNALAMDYSPFGLTEDVLKEKAGTEEFKNQMEQQVSMQPGVTLEKNTAGKYNDKYASYDMSLNVDKEDYKGTVQQRTVFYKSFGITLIYKPGKKGVDSELKDKFFNSLKIEE